MLTIILLIGGLIVCIGGLIFCSITLLSFDVDIDVLEIMGGIAALTVTTIILVVALIYLL